MADEWRALIISDSHRHLAPAITAIDALKPYIDCVIHLGDVMDDVDDLKALYPELAFLNVAGNCDYGAQPQEHRFKAAGFKLHLSHGHRFGVKGGYAMLLGNARRHGDDIALCGHTHIPYSEWHGRTLVLNPGSIGMSLEGSFAVLKLKSGETPRFCFGSVRSGNFEEAIGVLTK